MDAAGLAGRVDGVEEPAVRTWSDTVALFVEVGDDESRSALGAPAVGRRAGCAVGMAGDAEAELVDKVTCVAGEVT